MPPKGHYVREWRTFRRLSLARLAQLMERQPGEELLHSVSLGRIERGEQPLTIETLNALGLALQCEPTDLLTINPLEGRELIDLLDALRSLPPERVEIATRMLKAMA